MRHLQLVPCRTKHLFFVIHSYVVVTSESISSLAHYQDLAELTVPDEFNLEEVDRELEAQVSEICAIRGSIFKEAHLADEAEISNLRKRGRRLWSPQLVVPSADSPED